MKVPLIIAKPVPSVPRGEAGCSTAQLTYSDTAMLSLVSQKVLSQPSTANKKKQYEMHNVLGTGSFGKVMVRSCTPKHPSHFASI